MAEHKAQNLEPFFRTKVVTWRKCKSKFPGGGYTGMRKTIPQKNRHHRRRNHNFINDQRVEAKLTQLVQLLHPETQSYLSCEHNRLKKQTPNGYVHATCCQSCASHGLQISQYPQYGFWRFVTMAMVLDGHSLSFAPPSQWPLPWYVAGNSNLTTDKLKHTAIEFKDTSVEVENQIIQYQDSLYISRRRKRLR